MTANHRAEAGGTLQPSGLIEVVREQMRVVGALMMREIYTRFGRDNIGFFWIVAEPAFFCVGVIGMWTVIGHENTVETPLVPFMITGYMPLLLYRHSVGRMMRCMQANSALLYHRSVTIVSLYTSRFLVELLGTLASFIICCAVFGMLGYVKWPADLTLIIGGWLLYAGYTFGIAVLVGALSERSETVEKFWQPFNYIMIPASGTFYMVSWLPPKVRELALLFPQVNGTEMIRAGYFGPSVKTYFHVGYVLWADAFIICVALYMLKDTRKHLEIE